MTRLPPNVLDLTGQVVANKYRVEALLGAGGMGTVWRGSHVALGTPVAIKFMLPQHAGSADARQRFEIEAQATARIRTKHVVHVFDYGETEQGLAYIVMEYLEGESLSDKIVREGPLPAPEVARIIAEAARALERAHAAGIVHRDLKPDNIYLCSNSEDIPEGQRYIVKLVDFGIAKLFLEPVTSDRTSLPMGGPTRDGAVIGTPNFMSPEQLTIGGAPSVLSDVWSLGACAYSAFVARIPFEGDVLGDIVLRVCSAPPPVPSRMEASVPAGFDAWFARACARDARKRFQSARELAAALEVVCGVAGRGAGAPTADDDSVQYRLKPATAEALAALAEMEEPRALSTRTALLAGFVLALAIAVGLAGLLAYRAKVAEEQFAPPPDPAPAPSAPR